MFEFQTWEWTIVILFILIVWGILAERYRRKQRRPPFWVAAQKLLARANVAAAESVAGVQSRLHTGNFQVSYYDRYDPDDKYVAAALGMDENKRAFYEQALETYRNNEYNYV